MDVHLREIFDAFQQHFGVAPGLGRGCGGSLATVPGLSTAFLKAVFRAAAAVHRTNPWKKLKSSDLFGLRIGKDSDWLDSKPPFFCVQFVSHGDWGLNLFRTEEDAVSTTGPRGSLNHCSFPKQGFLRLVFGPEAELSSANRKLIKQLGLTVAGDKAFPLIDVVHAGKTFSTPSFRLPTLEELRWLFACLRALEQVHPVVHVVDKPGLGRTIEDAPQFIDIQWPAEDRKEWDITCVKVSCPPREEQSSEQHLPPRLASDNGNSFTNSDEFSAEMADALLACPRQCIVCDKEVSADSSPRCSRCKAVIYCSHVCQKKHWKESHKGNCELYKAMMDREEELEIKGFGFPCFMDHSCRWLELLGLHGKGMWRRVCGCFRHCPFGLLPPSETGEVWGVEEGKFPSDEEFSSSGMMVVSNWSEYYELRDLPAETPVAVLLSFPLTVYYILTALNPFTKSMLAKNKEVVMHYIGPEAELDWIVTFTEISHLLGGVGKVHVVMIGPEVPGSLSGMTEILNETVKVTYVQGMYQEQVDSVPAPHLVVGLNSSIDSDGNWMGALETIRSLGVAAFFTDYSETCCLNAKQVVRAAGLHLTYPLTPNPFRSPVRIQMPSTNVPWFSNGFIFGINT